MGEQFKLDQQGTCTNCQAVSVATENLQCFMCKSVFHGACPGMSADDKPGTKSLIELYGRPSTKKNFKFFCDCCLTNFEVSLADSETNRLNKVESNISTIKQELDEIKNLLKASSKTNQGKNDSQSTSSKDSIWFDKARLESTKVPPAEPMLVMKDSVEASETVEKAILENGISVTKSFKSNSGELVLVCENKDSCDKLQNIISNTTENIVTKQMNRKKPSITIVGLRKKYEKEEVLNLLVAQNQHLKQFSTVNNINEHFEIHDIKPTRAKESVFQVFASVSEVLRNGLSNYNDKVTIGLINCKVYDRFLVKRCNNCQGLGHFYKDCPTPNEPRCAKCSLNHATNSCTNTETKKCVNCAAKDLESDHTTFDPKCPSVVREVEKKKDLNRRRTTMANQLS